MCVCVTVLVGVSVDLEPAVGRGHEFAVEECCWIGGSRELGRTV